jgi:hypothetical protein
VSCSHAPLCAAITATGVIWSRYSTQINPVNYNLLAVNIFMAATGSYQLYRKCEDVRQSTTPASLTPGRYSQVHTQAGSYHHGCLVVIFVPCLLRPWTTRDDVVLVVQHMVTSRQCSTGLASSYQLLTLIGATFGGWMWYGNDQRISWMVRGRQECVQHVVTCLADVTQFSNVQSSLAACPLPSKHWQRKEE